MQPDLSHMSTHDLCDLLVVKTIEYLSVAKQKGVDGIKVRDLKLEIQAIEVAINEKKSSSQ
jgi:hypothetical protein